MIRAIAVFCILLYHDQIVFISLGFVSSKAPKGTSIGILMDYQIAQM